MASLASCFSVESSGGLGCCELKTLAYQVILAQKGHDEMRVSFLLFSVVRRLSMKGGQTRGTSKGNQRNDDLCWSMVNALCSLFFGGDMLDHIMVAVSVVVWWWFGGGEQK